MQWPLFQHCFANVETMSMNVKDQYRFKVDSMLMCLLGVLQLFSVTNADVSFENISLF